MAGYKPTATKCGRRKPALSAKLEHERDKDACVTEPSHSLSRGRQIPVNVHVVNNNESWCIKGSTSND